MVESSTVFSPTKTARSSSSAAWIGENVIVKKDDIEDMGVIQQSVMPEDALKLLTEQQICDLFAYLRSSQPINY